MVPHYHVYHAHRHMGSNSSVTAELARELTESVEYTLNLAGGIGAHESLEQTLRLGQEMLAERISRARAMLELVTATGPQWQTDCRWEAIRYLRHYVEEYDHLHLAHRGPEGLFYPILIAPPEGVRGIDQCLFYLNILWIENQIMAAVPEAALEELWDRLPPETLNQCEQVLLNGMGKAILNAGLDPLVFEPEAQLRIIAALLRADEASLEAAARRLCRWLDLREEQAVMYVKAVLPQMKLWMGGNLHCENVGSLFV